MSLIPLEDKAFFICMVQKEKCLANENSAFIVLRIVGWRGERENIRNLHKK